MKSLKNYLIVIGSTLPYHFPADYVKQTAKILSKTNKVIVFLWGDARSLKEVVVNKSIPTIIKKDGKILLFTPIHVIPFRRFEFIRQLNLRINVLILRIIIWLKRLSFNKKILWIFNYELYSLPVFLGKDYLSIYDCVDYFSSLNSKINQEIKNKQAQLINNVNYFFVNSSVLQRIFKRNSPTVVSQGFDLKTFIKSANKTVASVTLPKTKPLIGYIGSLNYRLDYALLYWLAKEHQHWNFVFIGDDQSQTEEDKITNAQKWKNKLFTSENVYKYATLAKSELPPLIKQFDCCLIPYSSKISFNHNCYPMKVFEYFYIGKPVVATNIESLKPLFPLVQIANNKFEFEQKLAKMLSSPWPDKYVQKQRELARINSWEEKIKQIISTINL